MAFKLLVSRDGGDVLFGELKNVSEVSGICPCPCAECLAVIGWNGDSSQCNCVTIVVLLAINIRPPGAQNHGLEERERVGSPSDLPFLNAIEPCVRQMDRFRPWLSFESLHVLTC